MRLGAGLLMAVAVLIALRLAPNEFICPCDAINPHSLVAIVVLVMSISALGYSALRVLRPRYGLPLAGLASGFISSSATIDSMGRRTRDEPELMPGLVASAVLSSVATVVQLALVTAYLAPTLLAQLAWSLLFGRATAVLCGAWFTLHALRAPDTSARGSDGTSVNLQCWRAFPAILVRNAAPMLVTGNFLGFPTLPGKADQRSCLSGFSRQRAQRVGELPAEVISIKQDPFVRADGGAQIAIQRLICRHLDGGLDVTVDIGGN